MMGKKLLQYLKIKYIIIIIILNIWIQFKKNYTMLIVVR